MSRRPHSSWIVLLALFSAGCANVYRARPGAPADERRAATALYVMGDFGTPGSGFRSVINAISNDLTQDESRQRIRRLPVMLELGDNMYGRGLPRPGLDASRERERLRKMALALEACRYQGKAVPLFLIPGNHDYNEQALGAERSYGDITRWFFLEDFGLEGLASWRSVPGLLQEGDKTASKLYDRIYESPGSLVEFMFPRLVPGTGPEISIVAIDSELLMTLFEEGYDNLAELYLGRLRAELRKIPAGSFRAVAAHHPLETYGNRPAQLGRFILGPGWPQFPEWWHKLAAIPPFAQLATFGRWLVHSRQDIHSSASTKYREKVYRIMVEEGAEVFFAGHDHNNQLIDLGEAMGDHGQVIQVLTGSAAKASHPVTSGAGTIYYHLGHGYVRVLVFSGKLLFEMKDSQGHTLFRHALNGS